MWVLERGGSSEIICSGWLSYRRRRSERLLAKFPTTAWFGVGGLPPRLNLLWPWCSGHRPSPPSSVIPAHWAQASVPSAPWARHFPVAKALGH